MSALSRWFPIDALAVLLMTGATYAATGLPAGAPVRVMVAVIFLLFVPGYALTMVLFPAGRRTDAGPPHVRGRSAVAALDGYERLSVSFGLSLALLPLFGLALATLAWGFDPAAVMRLTALFVVPATAVGVLRRIRLDRDVRYTLPLGRWRQRVVAGVYRAPAVDRLLNVALAVAVVVALGSLTVGLAAPQDGTSYTSFALLTRADGGDLVAADYPTEFSEGQSQRLVFTVGNHEGGPVHYVIVVQVQRISDDQVTDTQELERYNKRVPAGGTWQVRHSVAPSMTGEDLRLAYLLYRGSAPPDPTVQNAYRHVTLWIDVSS